MIAAAFTEIDEGRENRSERNTCKERHMHDNDSNNKSAFNQDCSGFSGTKYILGIFGFTVLFCAEAMTKSHFYDA